MSYFTEESLEFLTDLRENNEREWFHTNKKRYEKYIKNPFKEFVAELIFRIQEFDLDLTTEPKNAIFRINRDIRFTKDKSPYKSYISANMTSRKRTEPNYPGYYIHVDPKFAQIGGGSYHLDKHGTQAVREAIVENQDEFNRVINNKDVKKLFGEIQGDKNKRIPAEFKEVFDGQPLIANKNFYYMTKLDADVIINDNFVELVAEYHRVVYTLNKFLKSALAGL